MLTPEVITTVAAYAFGLVAGAGGLAVVVHGLDPTEPGRHRRAADPTPDVEASVGVPVPAEQAWARLAEALPSAEAERDAERTPTDDRLRVGPAASSAETLPLPHAGALATVAGELVLEYRGGAA
ncbi:hypothetical protein ACIA8K_06875 [Catenuloplanes sp. NPDC051500]|uniref:hypothetical protein n=1 Tax=Catenuloplanes sp. NPDC051500 TaxID=3363959 RepID=UPI0037AB71E5